MAVSQKLIELIQLQELTAAPRVTTGECDVTGMEEASIVARLGRAVTDAFSAGVTFRVDMSLFDGNTNGDIDERRNLWIPHPAEYLSEVGSSVAEEAVNGTCAADQNVIPMASTTGFAVGDFVFSEHTTVASSEFGEITVVTADTSVTLIDDLVVAQTGATVRDQAERYIWSVNVRPFKRVRLLVDGSGAGQNFFVEAFLVKMR